jgi:hypothetical protein
MVSYAMFSWLQMSDGISQLTNFGFYTESILPDNIHHSYFDLEKIKITTPVLYKVLKQNFNDDSDFPFYQTPHKYQDLCASIVMAVYYGHICYKGKAARKFILTTPRPYVSQFDYVSQVLEKVPQLV